MSDDRISNNPIYPKDPHENLAWRLRLLRRAKEDGLFQEKLVRLFYEDILFAFNAFFFTLDVRKRPFHNQPFCTYEFQDLAILDIQRCIREGRDLALEKSRDMGVSWMVLLVILFEWLSPEGGGDYLTGSRIENYVDRRGDMRTLFEKLRYAFYKLPGFLRPKRFNRRVHDTFAKLVNPETGASITGESNNPNFSTGGRYAAIFYDEFAKWERTDVAAWTAGGDASPCRIAASTPFGEGGQFYSITVDGKTKKLRLHWSLHPEKALGISCVWPPPNESTQSVLKTVWEPEEKLVSPWYQKECERRSENEIKQELDIEYTGSGAPVFSGKAMASIQLYRKIPDTPVAWGSFEESYQEMRVVSSEPRDPEGFLIIYKEPVFSEGYVISSDVVEGIEGGDYASVTVLNRTTKDVDAIYYSRVDEIVLAWIIRAISKYFCKELESIEAPWVGVETTGPGLATFDKLVDLGITNLFMAPRYDVTSGQATYKKGWRTDLHSRNELIGGIKQYLLERSGHLHSHRLLGELITFVRSATGKPQAKSGCHDDMVISLGIAIQIDLIAPPHSLDKSSVQTDRIERFEIVPPNRDELRDKDGPKTIEDYCYETALSMRSQHALAEARFDDFI